MDYRPKIKIGTPDVSIEMAILGAQLPHVQIDPISPAVNYIEHPRHCEVVGQPKTDTAFTVFVQHPVLPMTDHANLFCDLTQKKHHLFRPACNRTLQPRIALGARHGAFVLSLKQLADYKVNFLERHARNFNFGCQTFRSLTCMQVWHGRVGKAYLRFNGLVRRLSRTL